MGNSIRTNGYLGVGLLLSALLGSLALPACGGSDEADASPDLGGAGGTGAEGGESGAGGTPEGGGGTGDGPCGDRSLTGAEEVTGLIDDDATWQGVVHVKGQVRVTGGAALTIMPGTRVMMAADSSLQIAPSGGTATLDAEGTAEAPIQFCGVEEDAGYWGSLAVGSKVTSNSVLKNTWIADGGGAPEAALVLDGSILVSEVTVTNAAGDAVSAFDFDADSTGLSAVGNAGAAVILTGEGAVEHFPLGGSLSDNEEDVVRLRFGSIQQDTTFANSGVPYVQEGDVITYDAATVTFEAGVDYRFAADASLYLGSPPDAATLIVSGTEAEPVVFQGEEPTAGFWGGLVLEGTVTSDSELHYLTLKHGGGTERPFELHAPVLLDHVHLESNAREAWISEKGLAPASEALSITGSDAHPLTVEVEALITLPNDGSFIGNGDDRVVIEGGQFGLDGTIPALDVPYRVETSFHTQAGSHLRVEAGAVFEMAADTYIEIAPLGATSTFEAIGTEAKPIIFRGVSPTPGYWLGLYISYAATTSSILDFVQVGHAGQEPDEANLIVQAAITVTNSHFHDSASDGITKKSTVPTNYALTNTFENIAGVNVSTF